MVKNRRIKIFIPVGAVVYKPLTKIEVLKLLVDGYKPRQGLKLQAKVKGTEEAIEEDILQDFNVTPKELNHQHRIGYVDGVYLGLNFLDDKTLKHDGEYNNVSETTLERIIEDGKAKRLSQNLEKMRPSM